MTELYWDSIKSKLKDLIDINSFENWIDPIKFKSSTEKSVTLLVPNFVFYQIILDEYLEKIELAKDLIQLKNISINFEVENSLEDSDYSKYLENNQQYMDVPDPISFKPSQTDPTTFTSIQEDNENLAISSELINSGKQSDSLSKSSPGYSGFTISRSLSTKSQLNPNYTFDSFVKGPSNQFAYATCLNVAENPGKTYNPLFIYGASGLGKTHLMHAVGNRVLDLNPDASIMYISSEKFMNEMIYCLRFNKMWDFRQKFRQCDVFLVDDIQFISKKKATQEEFFHTFNSLYDTKKQIVITSDMFPQDIPDIEERLRNRFQWGLISDIQPPDMEHRIAILLNKADQLEVNLPQDVAEFIASHAKKNVRELEGALHRLAAFTALHGRRIDLKSAGEIFQSIIPDNSKKLDIDTIQKVVSDYYNIKLVDLKGKKRQKTLTIPRQVAMYLSRTLTSSSFPEIGDRFGGKDHTTVMHAFRKVQKEIGENFELKSNIEYLERQIEQLV